MKKKLFLSVSIILVLSMFLAACQTSQVATEAPTTAVDCKAESASEAEGAYQVPAPIEGCFNVAFVYVGPHDDGGWSQSHDVGRQ